MSKVTARGSDGRKSERVLVLAPTPGDSHICRRYLAEAGLAVEVCEGSDTLDEALRDPPGALVVTEEALESPVGERIRTALTRQEEWSLLPLVVLTRNPTRTRLRLLDDVADYGRVSVLERPVRLLPFISAVRMALTERRQQLRIRELLAERADRIRQRDEFLALLGHELRNPLAAIMTCADILRMAPQDGEQGQRCRDLIDSQAHHMKRLLDDLVDVSRIARGKLAIQREPLDLRRVLEGAITGVRGRTQGKSQVLEADLGPSPIPLLGDPVRLQQVFANLLGNASRYSPPGARIVLSARSDQGDGLAQVRVRDPGIGMTEETLAHVFDPFYQAADQGNGSSGGLGVGLALARSLVEQHAGTLTATSEGPGRGSELVVTLPLEPETETAEAGRGPVSTSVPASEMSNPRRVLVVDDNQDFAAGLKTLLEARGHQVDVAHDGPEGIRVAEHHQPDVVVLDIGLPGLDGYEVARRLRRLAGLSGVRLVAVTGYGTEQSLRRSRLAGIDRHLVKPVALPDLEAAITGA
jgi:signal transduction histidine kinase